AYPGPSSPRARAVPRPGAARAADVACAQCAKAVDAMVAWPGMYDSGGWSAAGRRAPHCQGNLGRRGMSPRVHVVGSGPNGLAAALVLQQAGCDVTLYERAAA